MLHAVSTFTISGNLHILTHQTQWSILLWRASEYEDDPFFMAASVENQPGSSGMDAETLLRQIISFTEGTDFGDGEQMGIAATPESTHQNTTDDTSATESQHQSNEQLKDGVKMPGGSHDLVAIETQEPPGQTPEKNSSALPRALQPVFVSLNNYVNIESYLYVRVPTIMWLCLLCQTLVVLCLLFLDPKHFSFPLIRMMVPFSLRDQSTTTLPMK